MIRNTDDGLTYEDFTCIMVDIGLYEVISRIDIKQDRIYSRVSVTALSKNWHEVGFEFNKKDRGYEAYDNPLDIFYRISRMKEVSCRLFFNRTSIDFIFPKTTIKFSY